MGGVTERLFVGIELDDDVRHGLAAHLAAQLNGRRLPGKAVAPASWHITLRFMGATEERQRDQVVAAISAEADIAPFAIAFSGLGAFPGTTRAAVVWLGIASGAASLERLAAVCESAAQRVGFAPEDRPFHPHLTLARVRPPRDVGSLVDQVAAFPLRQPVSSVALFRSTLGRGGARYDVIDRVQLVA